MKALTVFTAVLISSVLSGCAPTNYKITQAPPEKKDVNLQTIDTMKCNEASHLNWPGIFSVAICGVGAKICQSIRDGRYEVCMKDKGYSVKALD